MLRVNISGLIAPTLTQLKAAHAAAAVTAKLAGQATTPAPTPAPTPVNPFTLTKDLAKEVVDRFKPYVPPIAVPGSTAPKSEFKPVTPTQTPPVTQTPAAPAPAAKPAAPTAPTPVAPPNLRDAYTSALERSSKDPNAMGQTTQAWDAYRKSWTGAPKDNAEALLRVQDADSWNKLPWNANNQYKNDWLTPDLQNRYAEDYAAGKLSVPKENEAFTQQLLGDRLAPAQLSRAMESKDISAMNSQLAGIGQAAYEKALGGVDPSTASPEQLTAAKQAATEAQNAAKAWHAKRVSWTAGAADAAGNALDSSPKAQAQRDAALAKTVDAKVLEAAKTRVNELQQNGTAMSSSMKNVGVIDAIKQNPQILMVAGGLLAMMFGGKTGLILGGLAAAFGGKGLYDKYQNMQSVPVQKRYGEITDHYAKLKQSDPTGKQAEAYIAEVEKALTASSGNPELDKINNGVHSIFTVQSMFPDYVASQMSSAAQEQVAPFVGNEAAESAFAPPQAAK